MKQNSLYGTILLCMNKDNKIRDFEKWKMEENLCEQENNFQQLFSWRNNLQTHSAETGLGDIR